MGHLPAISHASSVTPPHQIHNPTPSYPTPHSSMSTLNSPASYHTSPPAVSSSLLSESNANLNHNDSVNTMHQYSNSMNLPPTPNSLVTMIGPNSNNSNSNEASSTPAETIDTIASIPSTSQSNHNPHNHYSPWATSNSVRPPISPDGSAGLIQPLSSAGVNGQMHHIAASPLPHTNQTSSFMQPTLHPFSHHSQMSKNFGMSTQYYPPWYWKWRANTILAYWILRTMIFGNFI